MSVIWHISPSMQTYFVPAKKHIMSVIWPISQCMQDRFLLAKHYNVFEMAYLTVYDVLLVAVLSFLCNLISKSCL